MKKNLFYLSFGQIPEIKGITGKFLFSKLMAERE